MRKAGLAKADRKASRTAAEGVLAVARAGDGASAAIVEVNCETDFVARQPEFQSFAADVAAAALAAPAGALADPGRLALAGGKPVEDIRRELVARIGENISVRRAGRIAAPTTVGQYVHHNGKSGALVGLEGGDEALARDVAMHVTSANPQYLRPEDVPAGALAKEREILAAQAAGEGKPAAILEKMIDGRLRKYLSGICLTGQPFVKDDSLTVGELLQKAGARATGFLRYEVGEGIERQQSDFAAEVMAQVKAAESRR
jgi:elongation factor Ts